MTDRTNSLTVILTEDVRVDDVQDLISAIGCMKNILKVEHNVTGSCCMMAKAQERHDIMSKLVDFIRGLK